MLTTVDLLASHDVEASGLLLFWRNVRNFFSSTAVKVVGIALLVLAGGADRLEADGRPPALPVRP